MPIAVPTGSAYADLPVTVLGYGFLGHHIVARLLTLGARVTTLSLPEPGRSLADGDLPARRIDGDIRAPGDVEAAVTGAAVVFNVAGLSGAVASGDSPFDDLDVNVRGTLTVLDTVRRVAPAAHVVTAGSRLQFGRPSVLPVADEAPQVPTSFYGLHRQAAEGYHRLFARQHGLRTTVLRLANPYGAWPDDTPPGYNVLNGFIRTALDDGAIELFVPATQRRDYLYVSDAVEAFLRAGVSEAAIGQAFNIGTGIGTAIGDAARLAVRIAGTGRVVERPWPASWQAVETGDCVLDSSRARALLGWSPQVALEDGIAMTVEAVRRGRRS